MCFGVFCVPIHNYFFLIRFRQSELRIRILEANFSRILILTVRYIIATIKNYVVKYR